MNVKQGLLAFHRAGRGDFNCCCIAGSGFRHTNCDVDLFNLVGRDVIIAGAQAEKYGSRDYEHYGREDNSETVESQ